MEDLGGVNIFGHLLLDCRKKLPRIMKISFAHVIHPLTRMMVSFLSFVGNAYFCESGLHFPWDSTLYGYTLFPNDPLWDGQNCTASSSCCQFNNPPWFTKNLFNSTTDDIELRICTTWSASIEDTPLELIELYIQ